MRKFLLSCWLLATLCFGYRAEAFVFWPGIGSSSGRALSPSQLPGLAARPLVKEKVNINGVPLTLEIYPLKLQPDELFHTLKNRCRPEHLDKGRDYLRAVFRINKTLTERWLFVFTGIKHPVTAFRMELSGQIPRPSQWPPELPPLPPGTRAGMVMELPRLNAVYGSFDSNDFSGTRQLASYSARLASSGWMHAGAEHSPAIMGSGEIYFKTNPSRQILWIKFGEDGVGAFYLKKIK